MYHAIDIISNMKIPKKAVVKSWKEFEYIYIISYLYHIYIYI